MTIHKGQGWAYANHSVIQELPGTGYKSGAIVSVREWGYENIKTGRVRKAGVVIAK